MPLFDLRKLNASLPVPPMKDSSLRILVLGAKDDFIVVKFFAFRVHTLDLQPRFFFFLVKHILFVCYMILHLIFLGLKML